MVVAARMNLDRTLKAGREQAEARMVDTCRITDDADPEWDAATGSYIPNPTVVYEGRCELKLRETVPQDQQQAGMFATVLQYTLKIPIAGTEAVRDHQTVQITASACDPGMVGSVFRIAAITAATYQTARRLPLEEVRPR